MSQLPGAKCGQQGRLLHSVRVWGLGFRVYACDFAGNPLLGSSKDLSPKPPNLQTFRRRQYRVEDYVLVVLPPHVLASGV